MEEMRISIITPTYNSEAFLEQTMRSVLEQNYENMEYFIVDAQSTDNTLKIAERMEPEFYGRLRIISEPDDGIYDAMNKGIRLASGDIIGIINSDDYYLPSAFRQVASILSNSDASVVYSDAQQLFASGELRKVLKSAERNKAMPKLIYHPTCFVRRAAYEKIGLYDTALRIVADRDLMERIQKDGGTFAKAPYPLAAYRLGGISDNIPRILRDKYLMYKKNRNALYAYTQLCREAILYYGKFYIKRIVKYDSSLRKRNRA